MLDGVREEVCVHEHRVRRSEGGVVLEEEGGGDLGSKFKGISQVFFSL